MAKILIVDDEHLTTEMLGTFLRIIGHESVEAFSSKMAWDKLAYESPDAILLDIMLPDVNGLDMCRQLRQNPSTSALPIIMISAYAPPLTKEADEAGASGYLVKPINLQSLKSTLAAVGINSGTQSKASSNSGPNSGAD
ncbi:MAG: response regulator [Chloroflexi bacterium]|nr:response regulator [Chloroflexota bacterium]